ncbi:glycosyltransferase family protein [Konateibacter massiliensis]|uniref:glycosyltransferase family protein n=1 Tax=Konateibacter massiliensis TaxID=2002841 RepID=UPI000C159053|nr:glycosyltransferase [Konateibacter massiliensis]
MEKNILFFVSRVLCYESNYLFIAEMEKELERLGYQVELCEVDKEEDDAEERMMQYVGKKFRAVIDFNSGLQRAEMDNGQFYLDMIDAPFYNYIVDHPLYHHPVIRLGIKRSNIICIDRSHASYLEKYYPNIQNVVFMPLGAMQALNVIPYEERKNEVLFSGTYISTEEIMEKIEKARLKEEILLLIQELKADVSQTPEEALQKVLKRKSVILQDAEFADYLNSCYLADTYLRVNYREQLIQTLLDHDIDVTVYGYDWEKFDCRKKEHLKIKGHVSFPVSLEVIADSKIVLNIMPWFRDGIHDRVLSAMINKSVCVTDTSVYIEENFIDEKELILYSLTELEALPAKIKELLVDTKRAKAIAECGYQAVNEKHMWKNRIEENIEKIK